MPVTTSSPVRRFEITVNIILEYVHRSLALVSVKEASKTPASGLRIDVEVCLRV
jgi:hypothetical protein